MDPRLDAALLRWDCTNPRPLAGDAGLRQYFRVSHPTLGTAILVLYPPVDPQRGDDAYFEFRALHAYLDPVLRVATILRFSDEDRTMLVEDLGDTTLERRLTLHPEEESQWAERVGEDLATWLGLLTQGAPPRAFFMLRSFDRAKFQFEWDYAKANFFGAFLEKDPPLWLERLMGDVHAFLEGRARYLAHRDFHVRNLMAQGDRLVTLDFQDARRAAATYDLASILFDGYWDWSAEARTGLADRVMRELDWPEDEFLEELTLSGLQRNFKALGTFGHQLVHRKKACFAPAIPRTLRHILGHFKHLHHGEGVLQAEHWLRLSKAQLLKGRE